jgi:hypothetical protein
MIIRLKETTEEDLRKYTKRKTVTFFDVCAKRTHFPVKIGCPFFLGNVIRCLDYSLNCVRCLYMYVYCKDLTGVGRV